MQKRVGLKQLYTSPYILAEVINAYFDECDAFEQPYTLSGLCLSVGCPREVLLTPWHKDKEIFAVLTQARLIIEQQLELRLLTEKSVNGVIFALKNLGWSDRAQLDINAPYAEGPDDRTYTIEVISPDKKPGKLKAAQGQIPYECDKLDASDGPDIPDPKKITAVFGGTETV